MCLDFRGSQAHRKGFQSSADGKERASKVRDGGNTKACLDTQQSPPGRERFLEKLLAGNKVPPISTSCAEVSEQKVFSLSSSEQMSNGNSLTQNVRQSIGNM